MHNLKIIAQTLWVGGLWVIGVLVAPALFAALPADRALAGMLAGRIFYAMAWLGMASAAILLLYFLLAQGLRAFKAASFWLVMGMLALTILNHFAIFPIIAAVKQGATHAAQGMFGGGLGTWHAISTVLYFLQALLGIALILQENPRGK